MANLRQFAESKNDNKTLNNVGTEVYSVPDKDRFVRALTIGADAGTFYVSQRSLSKDVIDFVSRYIDENPRDAVATMVEISTSGRAPKETHNLFALAIAYTKVADERVRKALVEYKAFSSMVRTTFHLTEFINNFRALGFSFSRARGKAVASWYEDKSTDQLAFQVAKYPSRGGYSHLDIIRLSHPKGIDENLMNYIKVSQGVDGISYDKDKLPQVLQNMLLVSNLTNADEVVDVINDTSGTFQWEFLRTEMLNEPDVWRALLKGGHVGYRALMWNISRFEKIGLLGSDSDLINGLIRDDEAISKSRIHPLNILNALFSIYLRSDTRVSLPSDSPHYDTGETLDTLMESLEYALEKSFGNVEATGKKIALAVDVSASMDFGDTRKPYPRHIAAMTAAMMLRNEDSGNVDLYAFSDYLINLKCNKDTTFSQVLEATDRLPFSSTDASLVFRHALEENLYYDAIVVLTDNDTYCCTNEGLEEYRNQINKDAKLVVVSISGWDFSINDPNDPNGLDVAGFDAGAMGYVTDFIAGRV